MHIYMLTIMYADGSRFHVDRVPEAEVAGAVKTAMDGGLGPVGIAIVRLP